MLSKIYRALTGQLSQVKLPRMTKAQHYAASVQCMLTLVILEGNNHVAVGCCMNAKLGLHIHFFCKNKTLLHLFSRHRQRCADWSASGRDLLPSMQFIVSVRFTFKIICIQLYNIDHSVRLIKCTSGSL